METAPTRFASGAAADLFAGESDVRALMRACQWEASPLGHPRAWPQSLRAVVRTMLTSRFAMWMAWGPELTFLCNDAYLPTVGLRRDWVIGSRSDKVWAEIWPDIFPRIERVLTTGEATWDEALLLYLERSGFTEETYHTFSYSPLADDAGETRGMLCVVAEVTEKVIGERQLDTLRDLGSRLSAASTRAQVMAALEESLAKEPRDLPFALAYLAEAAGQRATPRAIHGFARDDVRASSSVHFEDQTVWPLAKAMGGETVLMDLEADTIRGLKFGHWQKAPDQALIVPMSAAEGGAPVGYLVAGLNPHRTLNAAYKGFVQLLAAQVSAAIARADDFELARERADALAEIDRAKTVFFSNISHEFRTPLTLMLGPLEDAIGEPSNSPAHRAQLEIAERNALRLLRLVNALLDFSRIEAGRIEVAYRPTDLSALTAELASSFRSAVDRAGIRLVIDTPPLSSPVHVDHDMWEKIVLNLLSNAFKFTFEGEIRVELREVAGSALLTVSDTGVGIPAEELPKIFDRFHRVKGAEGRSFEGSGIGLSLVEEFVKQHGGEIGVKSELGRGASFTVRIPLGSAHLPADRIDDAASGDFKVARAQSFVEEALRWLPGREASDTLLDDAEPDLPAAKRVAPDKASAGRVLLADDNADLRGYISRLLADRGYEVEAVADGAAALESARASKPDLIVTDVMMPKVDGFRLLQAVRADADLRDLPVIMLSARAGEEAKIEGLEKGADDYLTKPFSARELAARVATNIAMARLRREAAEAIELSEAEAKLHAERVQLALDAGAIIGTWSWDIPNDRFVADERFARFFGLDPEEARAGISALRTVDSIHEDDRPLVREAGHEAMKRGGFYRRDYRVRQADGSYRWVEANGRVYLDARGEPQRFPGVLIDIDHRRRIEQELRELNDELGARVASAVSEREKVEEALRQAQKMEAVGQLTGGIAHDFNNLLTIITGNVDTARRALNSGEMARARRALDNAQKGAERAAALTQRLLAFSRRQPLAPRSLDVDKLVGGMSDLLNRALGETVRLEIISTPGLWRVEADPNQLENAILNLAVNSRDAMPEGGQLTIETANAYLSEQYSAAHAEVAPGSYVVIAASDTGHGMTKETLARVFDPFFTTKEPGRGTGLGLSMVYGFVKQSGGHIKIYSEPGAGTSVKIYLPRLMNFEDEQEAPPQIVDAVKRARTVLVVEDDHDVRAYTVEIMRELGYRVLEAHDGAAALRLLERDAHNIDLLFTDVVMPEMSGRQLVDKAHAIRPGLKILYTSGYTRNAIVHGGRLDAGVQMIAKPFTYQALAEKVADVLDSGSIGRVLVADGDAGSRERAVRWLERQGFAVDLAATALEALSRFRAAQGRYDMALIADGLPDKTGDSLALELRAIHADLPLAIAGRAGTDGARRRFEGQRLIAFFDQPYDEASLRQALAELGVSGETGESGVS